MFIIDIAHAYRNIKLQEQWWRFTAFRILNLIFFDTRLPMGSRSSPYLWMQFVIVLMWILKTTHGLKFLVDYMDDFFGAERTLERAKQSLNTFLAVARQLDLPIALEKIQIGTMVEFLGICIDSISWKIYFTDKKRKRLSDKVAEWLKMATFTRKSLQSMIGKLVHASIVYFGGGTFTKPLIHKLGGLPSSRKINVATYPEIELSLRWWEKALKLRGDRLITEHLPHPTHQFWSDASTGKGLGAMYLSQWYSISWQHWNPWYQNPNTGKEMHINILELLAVILSCSIWGSQWSGGHVLIHCDNEAVCTVVSQKKSKDEIMNHLLMVLHYMQIHYGFSITIEHIPTELNIDADDLSRYKFKEFFIRNPHAEKTGETVNWANLPQFQTRTSFLSLPTINQQSLVPPHTRKPQFGHG
jgi:hypothetical protein